MVRLLRNQEAGSEPETADLLSHRERRSFSFQSVKAYLPGSGSVRVAPRLVKASRSIMGDAKDARTLWLSYIDDATRERENSYGTGRYPFS